MMDEDIASGPMVRLLGYRQQDEENLLAREIPVKLSSPGLCRLRLLKIPIGEMILLL